MKFAVKFSAVFIGVLVSLISAQSFAAQDFALESNIDMQWDGGCSQPANPAWFNFSQPQQPVPVQSWVNWNQWQVMVNFRNTYPFPIICQGTLYGQTYHGRTGYLNFHLGPFPSGVTAYAYMNTVYGDPIVNGWANSVCYQY